jgi:3',5'-cyclic AMP phosphodiesterase CpdA
MSVLACTSLATAAPWRFAVVADTRGTSGSSPINTAAVNAIVQSLTGEGIDLLLVPGDLVNGSTSVALGTQLSTWRAAMAPIYSAGIAVYPIRGNHETAGGTTAWKNAFPDVPQNGPTTPASEVGLTYSVTHNNALFIGFDEYVRSHRVNQAYLDGLLNAPDRPAHVFVFGHEPAFSASHTDTLASDATNRDIFWNSLGGAGVSMYFCGHDHFYARSAIEDANGNPVQQLIVGAGGAPFHIYGGYSDPKVQPIYNDDDHYGYLLVSVEGLAVNVQYKAQLNVAQPNVFTTVDQFAYGTMAGDVDGDGHVDVVDLLYLVDAFGSVPGDLNYSVACDFNRDDSVDVVDLLMLVENFGA